MWTAGHAGVSIPGFDKVSIRQRTDGNPNHVSKNRLSAAVAFHPPSRQSVMLQARSLHSVPSNVFNDPLAALNSGK